MKPILNGLVLAGGRSRRMGTDKGKMIWNGKEQRYRMADLLKNLCEEVFISCRKDQEEEIKDNFYKTLPDNYLDLGPFGALLSAFEKNHDVAWLVIACDLPLMDKNTLKFLIDHRRVSAVATSYASPIDLLPEPLVAIWEPAAYALLRSFLREDQISLRKVLAKCDVEILQSPNAESLINVNSVQDLDNLKDRIADRV